MAAFEPWDIVKVPFPYTDRPVRQRRPALVVAEPSSAAPSLLWLLMITSAQNRGWAGDVAVSDLRLAGLPAPSIVRSAKIATVEARDAERLGSLPPSDRVAVTTHLRRALRAIV